MESQLRPARISAVTFERSTNSFRAPRPLRMPPVDAFTQIAELGRRYRHRSVHSLWPDEAAALQPLREQAHALAVVPQHLDQAAAAAAEHKQMAAMRIALQGLLDQQRQTVEALAHVGMAGRQPNLGAGGDRDGHREPARSAAIIAVTVAASAAPLIRILVSVPISTSINP